MNQAVNILKQLFQGEFVPFCLSLPLHSRNHTFQMKNKHLVLLFVLTLVIGLFSRFSPWFKSKIFQVALIQIDSARINQVSITIPGTTDLLLEKSDAGWIAMQDEFAVKTADSLIAPILRILQQIESIRIIETQFPDSLNLGSNEDIHLTVFLQNGKQESFRIGKEVMENNEPATYIELDKQAGIYLVKGHLRQVFNRKRNDFRSRGVFNIDLKDLNSVQLTIPELDTVLYQRIDSLFYPNGDVSETGLTQAAFQQWLINFTELNKLDFADRYAGSDLPDNLAGSISFETDEDINPATIDFYRSMDSNDKMMLNRVETPVYLIQSSQNVFNFFKLTDTLLFKRIFAGPHKFDNETIESD